MNESEKTALEVGVVAKQLEFLGYKVEEVTTWLTAFLTAVETNKRCSDKRRDRRLIRRGPCGHKWSKYKSQDAGQVVTCLVCGNTEATWLWFK